MVHVRRRRWLKIRLILLKLMMLKMLLQLLAVKGWGVGDGTGGGRARGLRAASLPGGGQPSVQLLDDLTGR